MAEKVKVEAAGISHTRKAPAPARRPGAAPSHHKAIFTPAIAVSGMPGRAPAGRRAAT